MFGKTSFAVDLAVDAVLAGKRVAYFCPTYKMLAEVWRELREALRPITTAVNQQEHRIGVATGGVVDFWSLDVADAARGRAYHLVVLDEAAMVPDLEDAWNLAIRPTLTDYQGDAWFLSTPRGFNFFHTLWERGQKGNTGDPRYADYASWQMPTTANPFIPLAEIEKARGEVSDQDFSQEYLAQFVSGATRYFHPEWWLGDANRYDPLGIEEHPLRVQARGVFWDTALKDKAENAFSAACVLEVLADDRLALREVWRGRPQFPELVAETERLAQRWDYDGKLSYVVVEDKASGTSLVQTLAAQAPAWLARLVRPFSVTGPKPERWAKAAVWCSRGAVLLPTPGPGAPWLGAFEDEIFGVPNAPFLDQADAFSEGVIFFENYLARWNDARRGDAVAA